MKRWKWLDSYPIVHRRRNVTVLVYFLEQLAMTGVRLTAARMWALTSFQAAIEPLYQVESRMFLVPSQPSQCSWSRSFFFRFSGPSISVDTACSSSFAALHVACQSLWQGGCDTAIAGGTNVLTNPDNFAGLDRGHFYLPPGTAILSMMMQMVIAEQMPLRLWSSNVSRMPKPITILYTVL